MQLNLLMNYKCFFEVIKSYAIFILYIKIFKRLPEPLLIEKQLFVKSGCDEFRVIYFFIHLKVHLFHNRFNLFLRLLEPAAKHCLL